MILSDKRILEEMEKGTIKIVPYNREDLGSNSYDVHLGSHLATYEHAELDAKKHNTIKHFDIPEDGIARANETADKISRANRGQVTSSPVRFGEVSGEKHVEIGENG